MHKITSRGLLLFLLISVSNVSYAHSLTPGLLVVIYLMFFWPMALALIALMVGIIKKRKKTPYEKWVHAALFLFVIQIPWYIFIDNY